MVRQGTTSFGGEQVYGGASGGGAESDSDVPMSDFEDEDDDDDDEDDDEEDLPYPGFIPLALGCLDQTTRPRNWCLRMITNPYPFHTMLAFYCEHILKLVHFTHKTA
jgi:hypothetical protein